MAAHAVPKDNPPPMIPTQELHVDLAGVLHRVCVEKQTIGVFPTVDFARGVRPECIAFLVPAEEYNAFEAFRAFRKAIDVLNTGPRPRGIVE